MPQKENYQIEYDNFIQSFKLGQVSGEQVGEQIMKMVQYFCDQNMAVATREEALNAVAAKTVDMVDEASGKQISVSKAQILIDASPEYTASALAKCHLTNLEQIINSLKCLQRGIMSEYNFSGGV